MNTEVVFVWAVPVLTGPLSKGVLDCGKQKHEVGVF